MTLELTYALMVGALSGVVSSLAHICFWSILAHLSPARTAPWLTASGQNVVGILLHTAAGLGIGLAFWLSWGYAGLIAVPWWLRGLSFGGLSWVAFSLPVLLSQHAAGEIAWRRLAAIAAQWATTCLLTALTCSWSWAKIV